MQSRLGVLGAFASLAVHAGALAWLAVCPMPAPPAAAPAPPAGSVQLGLVVVPTSAKPESAIEGPVVPLPAGPADVGLAGSSSPLPAADIDVPDPRRASPGGGASGATAAWTGRHDGQELRAQAWNDPTRYTIPRLATARDRATTEAVAREPEPASGSSLRARSQRARRATVQASAQVAGATPAPGQAGESEATSRGVDGHVDPRAERPFVETGARAVDAPRHAAVADDVTVAQASDERQPEEFDLTRPRAGGAEDGERVAGPRDAPGSSAASDHGEGDGASPLDVPVGRGPVATRARLGDPYLRALYARVIERVVWPRRLAVAFEQGEVVVHFTLSPVGAVETLRVDRSSGYPEFDDAVVAAIRAAGPFGPVPRALSPAGQKLQVSAPFIFDNPMIR